MELFTNWTFDKVMDYMLAAVVWFVFQSKSKQNKHPDDLSESRRAIEIDILFMIVIYMVTALDSDLLVV